MASATISSTSVKPRARPDWGNDVSTAGLFEVGNANVDADLAPQGFSAVLIQAAGRRRIGCGGSVGRREPLPGDGDAVRFGRCVARDAAASPDDRADRSTTQRLSGTFEQVVPRRQIVHCNRLLSGSAPAGAGRNSGVAGAQG